MPYPRKRVYVNKKRDKIKNGKKLNTKYIGKINPKENNKEFKGLINEILNVQKK